MTEESKDENWEPLDYLKQHWGYSEFRPLQREIIETCLSGRDCFVLMATGAGKSVCYQLPPLMTRKPMIVISPLISLMEDQCIGLQERGISACCIHSGSPDPSKWSAARRGEYLVVYMSPERIETRAAALRELVDGVGVTGFAIDEAHCISEWGHHFRQAYRSLSILRVLFPSVPIMALTATATAQVQTDVMTSLKLETPAVFCTSFDRPNLFYTIRPRGELKTDFTKQVMGTGACIVYCLRRSETEKIAKHLVGLGITAAAYHASLSAKERVRVHKAFLQDDIQCVVATIAFAMGIDKPDVRTILHYGAPKSIESYYQQSGRAGRDGEPARCILFYSRSDFAMGRFYAKGCTADVSVQSQHLMAAMKAFVMSDRCRRISLLAYFGEKWKSKSKTGNHCGSCDNCHRALTMDHSQKHDFTYEARLFATACLDTGQRFGISTLLQLLRGAETKKLSSNRINAASSSAFGKLKGVYSEKSFRALGQLMINAHILENFTRSKFTLCRVGPVGNKLLQNPRAVLAPLMPPDDLLEEIKAKREKRTTGKNTDAKRSVFGPSGKATSSNWEATEAALAVRKLSGSSTTGKSASTVKRELTVKEKHLYEVLVDLRKVESKIRGLAPYQVCSRHSLEQLAMFRPTTLENFYRIEGIGQSTSAQYAPSFIRAISTFSSHNKLVTDQFMIPLAVPSPPVVASKTTRPSMKLILYEPDKKEEEEKEEEERKEEKETEPTRLLLDPSDDEVDYKERSSRPRAPRSQRKRTHKEEEAENVEVDPIENEDTDNKSEETSIVKKSLSPTTTVSVKRHKVSEESVSAAPAVGNLSECFHQIFEASPTINETDDGHSTAETLPPLEAPSLPEPLSPPPPPPITIIKSATTKPLANHKSLTAPSIPSSSSTLPLAKKQSTAPKRVGVGTHAPLAAPKTASLKSSLVSFLPC